jgi:DNA-binding YbaB/EbfC family protein
MIDPSKLQELMAQAQQMQDQMTAQLKTRVVTGEAGGGLVKITMNGMLEVTAVKIDPTCVDKSDVTLLEDLVRAAVGAAVKKVEEARVEGAKSMAGSMGLPPGMF